MNKRQDGRTRQRVPATIGRLDRIEEDGGPEAIVRSAARFSRKLIVLTDFRTGTNYFGQP